MNLPPLQPGSVKGMGLLGRVNELASYLGQLWTGANLRTGPGLLKSASQGGVVISLDRAALSAAESHPFFVRVLKDGEEWKVSVVPGTLNGLAPVVGDITGTGGTPLTDTPAPTITLATGENMVVLAIKVDLETHAILRTTVEVREDSELAPITDTGARTRITFDVLAQMEETLPEAEGQSSAWKKITQPRKTHLTYDYGVVYVAST